MSNFSNTRKLNTVYKDILAVVNTNSNLAYYDEVNVGSSYRNTVDVSNIKIDTVPASPDFTLFPNQMNTGDLSRFGITLSNPTSAFTSAKLDDTQTVIKFERVKLIEVGNSVDMNGGSFYFLDDNGKNLLEDMIPYTAANSLGQLDDQYENTKIEYGSSFTDIILQTNYHGNAILNHRQGLVTFNTNPSWSLKNGTAVAITNAEENIYLTFYKYVGKKGIRVLNSTDVSGGLVVGGQYSETTAPADGVIIQGNVGIGTDSPDKKLHISEDAIFDSIKISKINNNEHIGLGYRGIVKYQTGTFTLGLQNNSDLKLITNNTERMRINGDGNIGIGINNLGTDIPLEIFGGNIYGSGKKTRDTLTLRVNRGQGANTSSNIDDIGFGARLKFSHNTMSILNDNTGNSTSTDQYVAIESVSEKIYSGRIGLKFITDGGSPAEKMRIDATGNVGIGTPTPQHKLDVSGGNIHIMSGSLILDKSTSDESTNEGGEIRVGSYTNGTHNGYWTQDSIQDKLRIVGTDSLQVGNTALLINSDTINGLYKVGINKPWNYSQAEALDVSGNIRIDNGAFTGQGGRLIFDNADNVAGLNKIQLHSDGYGFGVDTDTLKYISGSSTHEWYYSGTTAPTATNGTLGMQLVQNNLTVYNDLTIGNILYTPSFRSKFESSFNCFDFFNGPTTSDTTAIYMRSFQSNATDTKKNMKIYYQDELDSSTILFDTTASSTSYFKGKLAIGTTNNAAYPLDVTGDIRSTGTIHANNNVSIGGTIQQSSSGTNTFAGVSEFTKRVQASAEITASKIAIGNTGLSNANADIGHELLLCPGTGNGSPSPSMRLDNFGKIEFTKQYNDGSTAFGTTTGHAACADWKIDHIYNGVGYGDHLAFSFERKATTSQKNTVLRLCPARHEGEVGDYISDTPASDLSYNAVFSGDVLIEGNLVVAENTTTRETIINTQVYNDGFSIPASQVLKLSDGTGSAQIRFDLSGADTPASHIDTLGNDTGKIFLAQGVKISVPATESIGYHCNTGGSHQFYTSDADNSNQVRLRIDNTNNVVIGRTSNDLSIGSLTPPSLLNLYHSTADVETAIQFANVNTTHPFRMGINSGASNINKFSFLTRYDTDIFTIDAENKNFGFLTAGLTSSDAASNTNSIGTTLDICGNLAVKYLTDDAAAYIGYTKIGDIKTGNTASFGNVQAGRHSGENASECYALSQDTDGNTYLNCRNHGMNIEFQYGTNTQMLFTDGTFNIGGSGGSGGGAGNIVNIIHEGTTTHTGNMAVTGDLLFNTSTHNITMNDNDHIKLDYVTINDSHLKITPSNNTTFCTEFNKPTIIGNNTLQNTIIRAGTASSHVIIGDMNTVGYIYLGLNVAVNTDYRIQSKPIAISATGNNSLYTEGNVNIDGNLNMNGSGKKINIGSGKLTIDNSTGDVVSNGNLSLYNSTDEYFKIYNDASAETFSVHYQSGDTIVDGTLHVKSQPFTVGGSVDTGIHPFKVDITGATAINNTLTINTANDAGIMLTNGDLLIKDQNIRITDNDGSPTFDVSSNGEINTGVWNATIISTSKGGLGADVDPTTSGQILISQVDGTYLPNSIDAGTGIIVTTGADGITIESTITQVTIDDLAEASNASKGLLSADDKTALSIIRTFMFQNNTINSNSNANQLHEGLVRKVKTYRPSTYYQFNSGTMSNLYVGSFLYDTNKPAAEYSDYGMVGKTFYMDEAFGGDYTIPPTAGELATNFSQSTTNTKYRVLFWQDYITTSDYGSIDIEFQCPNHDVDFSVSNYKYNSVLYVQDFKFNPLSELREYNDLQQGNGNILAEGKSQVKDGKGPRGQLFPLNGHFDYTVKDKRIRILVLVNTSLTDAGGAFTTDTSSRLDIDARNAYLKVTELNDSNTTT